MNDTMTAAVAGRGGAEHAHASSRLLAGFLFVSVALHALLILWAPGWMPSPVLPPAPVLEVVMVSGNPEPLPAPLPEPVKRQPVEAQPEQPRRVDIPPPRLREIPPADRVPIASPEPAALPETTAVAAEAQRKPAGPAASLPAPKSEPAREGGGSTPPQFNAAYLRNPPPRYPPAARRNGDQGTVMLRVLVNPEGQAARVELDQSSGFSMLDDAALEAVRNWRFVPARRGVQNVEAWVKVPVVFRLDS